MSSFYTEGIAEGNDSFFDYATLCAREFGAYHHMRDDEDDVLLYPLPDDEIIRQKKRLEDAQDEYDEFTARSEDSQRAVYETECRKRNAEMQKENARRLVVLRRYSDMLGRVIAWDVPEKLSSLKGVMQKNIESSIQFDCSPIKTTHPDFSDWRDAKVKSLERSIHYSAEALVLAKKQYEEMRDWHKTLMDHLS